MSDQPLTRYHVARQNDGRGWMLMRIIAFGSPEATVIAVDMTETDARRKLADLRATEAS